MRPLTDKDFLKDVAEHQMTLVLDNGVHRYMRFASTGKYSWNQWFEITTWPWHLCISGDMGTFVFNRLEDMFAFFRCRPEDCPDALQINPSYWSEKLEAADRRTGGHEYAYSEEVFKKVIYERFRQHEFENKRDRRNCWKRIRNEVLRYADTEHEAHEAAAQFKFQGEDDDFEFYDFWEADLTEWTFQYIWCCYAIVWAIRQYDKVKIPTEESVPA